MRLRSLAVLVMVSLVALASSPSARHSLLGPRNFVEVREGWLFRSARPSRLAVTDVLRRHSIGFIIDLTDDEEGVPSREREAAAARELGVEFRHTPVSGGRGATRGARAVQYGHALAELVRASEQGRPVWVHCEQGYRRSAALIALYARLIEGQAPTAAYAELQRFAEPDSNWAKPLQMYLERHLAEISAAALARRPQLLARDELEQRAAVLSYERRTDPLHRE